MLGMNFKFQGRIYPQLNVFNHPQVGKHHYQNLLAHMSQQCNSYTCMKGTNIMKKILASCLLLTL